MNDTILPIDTNVAMGQSIIKVIGVGGGGGNAVNHMFNIGIHDVTFALINTDRQALDNSPIKTKVLIGESGLGAGANPTVAQVAAEKDESKIREMLNDGTRMVFITATEGGGTGTGASPTVAKIAQALGILTVGIVTIPFEFEGRKKILQAFEGVSELSNYVDALLIINNQKLMAIYPQLQLLDAFHKADEVLAEAAKSVAEIVTIHGYINIDFADVYSTLHEGNIAIMNTGRASGEQRITRAIEDALCSPLINTSDVQGARKILLSFYCSTEHQIRMDEINQVHDFMRQMGEDVDVIWGAFIDESMGEDVKVTLIATGYEMSDIPGVPVNSVATPKTETDAEQNKPEPDKTIQQFYQTPAAQPAPQKAAPTPQPQQQNTTPQHAPQPQRPISRPAPAEPVIETLDLDDIPTPNAGADSFASIPAWMRHRK